MKGREDAVEPEWWWAEECGLKSGDEGRLCQGTQISGDTEVEDVFSFYTALRNKCFPPYRTSINHLPDIAVIS